MNAAVVSRKNNCDIERQQMAQDIKNPTEIINIFAKSYASRKTKNINRLQRYFYEFKFDFNNSLTEKFNRLAKIIRLSEIKD